MAAHGGASPPRSVSSHLNNFFDLHDNSLLSEDPEGNMVRSLHFTHLSRIYHKCLEVSRAAHETWFRSDAHDDAPRAPCRTRGATLTALYDRVDGLAVVRLARDGLGSPESASRPASPATARFTPHRPPAVCGRRRASCQAPASQAICEWSDAVRPHGTPGFAELLTRRHDLEDVHEQV